MGSARATAGADGLVVEFTGVTGAGKSTLLAAVKEWLAGQGYRVREVDDAVLEAYGLDLSRRPRWRSLLLFLLAVPAFWRRGRGRGLGPGGLRQIARDADSWPAAVRLARNYVKRVGTHELLGRLRRRLRACDFLLYDEGVVHAAHNLFVHVGRPPRAEDVRRFAAAVPKPDVVVWVTAPLEQSVECTLRRGHARVGRTPAAVRAFVEHAHATFDILAASPELRGRLLRVENPRPAGGGAAVVWERARSVGEFLARRRTGPDGGTEAP